MEEHPDHTPVQPDFPEETLCPSCGRFVGAYARCPYCGTKHGRRTSIRFFRIFSVTMAVVGVFIVWLAARGIKAPLIKIGDIMPTNAFAYVRVQGEVISSRIYDDGGVSFRVDDGTGNLLVRAYKDIGERLLETNRVPAPGDTVSAEGTLQLRPDFVQMIVNVPEKVTILQSSTPPMTSIADLNRGMLGQRVLIQGTITKERRFTKGSSLTVADATGSIDVIVWNTVRKRFGKRGKILALGKTISVRGKLGEYRGKLQITIDFPTDITEEKGRPAHLPPTVASPSTGGEKTDIGGVRAAMRGKTVEIAGTVESLTEFSKGKKLMLSDGTGSVEVLIWNSLYDRMAGAEELIREGARLRVRGRVDVYRGTTQVIPRSPDGVVRVKPGQ